MRVYSFLFSPAIVVSTNTQTKNTNTNTYGLCGIRYSVPDEEYAAVLGALVLHRSQCFRGKLAGLRVTVAKDAAHAERKGGTVTIPADAPSVPAHFDALLTMVSG